MNKTYLGLIEQGLSQVMVYYNDNGFVIEIYFNDRMTDECELLDSDHVWRELRERGYKKSFCKVIISML